MGREGGGAIAGREWATSNSGVGGGAIALWGVGVGAIVGDQQRGCLKPLRTALHLLNARWALPVYPVFEDERSKASDEKSVKRKIA